MNRYMTVRNNSIYCEVVVVVVVVHVCMRMAVYMCSNIYIFICIYIDTSEIAEGPIAQFSFFVNFWRLPPLFAFD